MHIGAFNNHDVLAASVPSVARTYCKCWQTSKHVLFATVAFPPSCNPTDLRVPDNNNSPLSHTYWPCHLPELLRRNCDNWSSTTLTMTYSILRTSSLAGCTPSNLGTRTPRISSLSHTCGNDDSRPPMTRRKDMARTVDISGVRMCLRRRAWNWAKVLKVPRH